MNIFLDTQGSAMNDVVKALLVNERVMSVFNENTDPEAITRAADLWSQTDMDGFSVFCASYDMPTDPGSFMEAFKNDFNGNRLKLSTYIATHSSEEGMSNTLKTWFGDADLNSFYRDDPAADTWDEDKWHALDVYTDEPEHDEARSTIISLLASGETALQDLRAIYGDKTMLQTRYRNNPTTYLSTYLASQGAEGLAAGLQAIPGMSGAKLIVDITQALGPKALAGYYEENVVGESFGLAEQHLYGSKRLGIKYYWPTMWWYWDSITHYQPIANTWTVATVPWYSSNWGDFIKPLTLPNTGSFNWLNNVDYSRWFTNRILGMKKYELSDYLGNVQAVIFDRHTPVVEADTITRYEADPYQMLDYYPYGMLMRQGYCSTCVDEMADSMTGGVLASMLKKTWTDDPITPESYPPQANAVIANWFVSAAESWQNKLKMEWMGSGGGMNFTCLATISSSAGDVGMAAGIATDPETEYTVTFNTDNGNAGTLTARIIHYNNSSHTTYTLLKEISVSRSSQNHISFTATADSVWLWVGHKANGTNLAAGTNFKVTSGSILRYTWSVAQSHIQSYLYNYGAYRFAYNGIERTDEKAGKGNYYTALHGEYDPRTTKRDNIDPKPMFGWSPYSMFQGNPIWHNDALLDSAWAIKKEWDGKMMDKYQKDVPGIIKGLQKSGKDFTCDDLALTAVMTFAKDNNLPFKWETGSGKFDAASDDYNDFSTFSHDVLSKSGAPDFQRSDNAFPVHKNGMSAGGLILNDRRSTGLAHHVQVVTRAVSVYSIATQSRQNIGFVIKQGNFNKLGRYLGSDDPKSSRYLGVPIQTGLYDALNDEFTNFSRDPNTPQRHFSTENDNMLEYRLFNFSQWNK